MKNPTPCACLWCGIWSGGLKCWPWLSVLSWGRKGVCKNPGIFMGGLILGYWVGGGLHHPWRLDTGHRTQFEEHLTFI